MSIQQLKEQYEKTLLIVATTVALVLVGSPLAKHVTFGEMFLVEEPRPNNVIPDMGMATLQLASQKLYESSTWKGRNLFVSAPVLEVNGERLEAFEPQFPQSWMKKYQLDSMDPFLSTKDPDGDQFTNAEEYRGETNPLDPSDHPPMIEKFRLVSITQFDLGLVFQGRVDPKTYQIDLVSETKFRSGNMLKEVGTTFGPGDQFRLDNYEEKRGVDTLGIPFDHSEATISYTEIGGLARSEVRLVQGDIWEMPSHEGRFESLVDGNEVVVKRGARLRLPNDAGRSYTLQSVTSTGAIFHDEDGKHHEVVPQE